MQINSITGELINFREYKNKAVLVVNTASYCGFTKQYEGLQELWEKYEAKGLIVLGVPSNSFNQEKKSGKEVKEFCEVKFDINFPLTSITEVKGKNAHDLFKWAKDNHGKSAIPKWNFHKILINKDGKISIKTRPILKYTIGDIKHDLVIKIDVIDNGIGIPKNKLKEIFYPMVTTKNEGMGLGLTIAQSIICLLYTSDAADE